jgi:hypothetical protein
MPDGTHDGPQTLPQTRGSLGIALSQHLLVMLSKAHSFSSLSQRERELKQCVR